MECPTATTQLLSQERVARIIHKFALLKDFLTYRDVALRLPVTLKHWRCGGILCYVCLVPLLVKVTTAYSFFYWLALFVCRNRSRVANKKLRIYSSHRHIANALLGTVIFVTSKTLLHYYRIYLLYPSC